MKRIFFLFALLLICSEAAAKCTYTGSIRRQAFTINAKIPTDDSIPVGSVLYSTKYGTQTYKNFSCNQNTNDQYITEISTPVVSGVTGIQGKPVYETGIDGIGFQVSDLLESRNGALVPAVAGSVLVPFENTSDNYYKFITVWFIKTKQVIDTSGSDSNPSISFSVGNPTTNPGTTEKLLYTTNIKLKSTKYQVTSCDISPSSSQITLNRIKKSTLMSVSRGGVTPEQKNILLTISCPAGSIGNTLMYWFNPVGTASTSGDGIIDNMITDSSGAKNVGIIFKQTGTPLVFYDMDSYSFNSAATSQIINLTADYYRQSNSVDSITNGKVKAMLEVVIQEQ
ncbi:TPA: fimbrial protein [Klebsiella aerogenes]|uniref:fimbrial protein n=1 Tax=Klebsiella aerogenes TaxID=548 RepID=UPI00063C5F43|nr:fimbrial protein [Klebsiella aerogenes]KLF12083.1 fimbrial protein [Klebsiella aerogenes]MDM8057897.1 fimbrial protein [Klebsiella aerogenes]MDM8080804.1 fimbrial protein [Klebsiella aerogenes]MDT8885298.1 fimbrial protein [Klebsiella aerogenes]MDY0848683.1 fimbrial protein [Klebsiella aerogenes]